jgi:hypothetical protein
MISGATITSIAVLAKYLNSLLVDYNLGKKTELELTQAWAALKVSRVTTRKLLDDAKNIGGYT